MVDVRRVSSLFNDVIRAVQSLVSYLNDVFIGCVWIRFPDRWIGTLSRNLGTLVNYW